MGETKKMLVLIGGNPKGFNEAFHPNTFSGKRLRRLLTELDLNCKLCDMTKNTNDVPSPQEITKLKKELQGCKIVFLGRFVERHLRKHFPDGVYLPHPASRRKTDLQRLEDGLRNLGGEVKG